MGNREKKKWFLWFLFAIAVIAVYKVFDSLSVIFISLGNFFNVIMPFILAVLFAYILYLPCRKLENLFKKSKFKLINNHSRGYSVSIVYIILILFIFLIFNFLIPNIKDSISEIIKNAPTYINNTINWIDGIDNDSWISKLGFKEYLNDLNEDKIIQNIVNWFDFENVGSYIKGILGATGIIFDIFVCMVVSIYILLERDDIKSFFSNLSRAMFNKKTYNSFVIYFHRTNRIFFDYFTAQIIDAIIVGILTTIAMLILKVKYAILLGFMIGLFNLIPYFGAIFAIVIAIIITIFTGGIKALWLGIIVTVLQQIDANIINPKIIGSKLELSKILIILGVTLGGKYFGALGMFLGVPILAFIKELLNDYIENKNSSKIIEADIDYDEEIEIKSSNK